MDPKLDKWRRWIVAIEREVIALNHYRRCNRVFEAIVNANPRLLPGNAYLDYFRNVYATYAAMAVRRHAKPHRDAISLAGLLHDLAVNPMALSRSWLRAFYQKPSPLVGFANPPEIAHFLADSTFRPFADASGEHLDSKRIEAQVASLDDATRDIVELVDRGIAHHDSRRSAGLATFSQLDGAIEMVMALTSDYTRPYYGQSQSINGATRYDACARCL